jgi:hypothetical protein
MKCCICNEEIPFQASGWDQGNNAEPVIENGRCCDECNWLVVIPRRLWRMRQKETHRDNK